MITSRFWPYVSFGQWDRERKKKGAKVNNRDQKEVSSFIVPRTTPHEARSISVSTGFIHIHSMSKQLVLEHM